VRGNDPILFDEAGAQQLASEFERTAALLEAQAAGRPTVAAMATQPWEGQLAEEFDDRNATRIADGQRLADAMRDGAERVRALTEWVAEENRRREHARQYEHEQANRGFWERTRENFASFFGGRDPVPPPPAATPPPHFEVLSDVTHRD
jgi:hypothetical protein